MTPDRLDRLACAVIACGSLVAAIALAMSDRPERSVPLFVAAAMSVVALVAMSPAIPRCVVAAAIALDAALTAGGAFDSFNHGDHVGHFVLTGLLVLLLGGLVDPGGTRLARIVTLVVFAMAVGLAWELLELASDTWLGTDMSLGLRDSVLDVIADVAGASVAAWWLVSRDASEVARRRTTRP